MNRHPDVVLGADPERQRRIEAIAARVQRHLGLIRPRRTISLPVLRPIVSDRGDYWLSAKHAASELGVVLGTIYEKINHPRHSVRGRMIWWEGSVPPAAATKPSPPPPPAPTATSSPGRCVPRVDRIISVVAGHFGISRNDLLRRCRWKHVAHARMVAMWLIRHLRNESLQSVGDRLHRDHATILYGLRAIERARQTDAALDGHLRLLTEVLTQPTEGDSHGLAA